MEPWSASLILSLLGFIHVGYGILLGLSGKLDKERNTILLGIFYVLLAIELKP